MFEFLDQNKAAELRVLHIPNLLDKKTEIGEKAKRCADSLGIIHDPSEIYSDLTHGENGSSSALELLTREYSRLSSVIRNLEMQNGS